MRAACEGENDAGCRVHQGRSAAKDHSAINGKLGLELVPEPCNQIRMGAQGFVRSYDLIGRSERRHVRLLMPRLKTATQTAVCGVVKRGEAVHGSPPAE